MLDYAYAALLKTKSFFKNIDVPEDRIDLKFAIIIPGVYETSIYFKNIISTLSSHYSIIYAASIYGKGGSIDENALSTARYIDSKGLSDVLIVGHSSGGIVAVKPLASTTRIANVITIAAPFHGVSNGKLLRTKTVRDLLPTSNTIKSIAKLPQSSLKKITSMYPSFDNQI